MQNGRQNVCFGSRNIFMCLKRISFKNLKRRNVFRIQIRKVFILTLFKSKKFNQVFRRIETEKNYTIFIRCCNYNGIEKFLMILVGNASYYKFSERRSPKSQDLTFSRKEKFVWLRQCLLAGSLAFIHILPLQVTEYNLLSLKNCSTNYPTLTSRPRYINVSSYLVVPPVSQTSGYRYSCWIETKLSTKPSFQNFR